MCLPMKKQKLTGDLLEELRLLQRVTKKLEMSIMSNCLSCIRKGRGNRMGSSCLDLAMEGQQSCELGDYRTGVSFFESAIQVGTEDLQLLSAIYSQMGNAYFQLKEHSRALEYYGYDFILTSTIGDEAGEAKACGNLANTLMVVGRCDEAMFFCQRHLSITRARYDKVGQAHALYIFGNVYHAKATQMSWSGVEPGHFTEEATAALRKAVQHYEANLSLVKERGDRAAEGLAYGKLGHTYHLLGEFQTAAAAHEKRLLIAEEFGDKFAERRAHCNLGSTHVYLGRYDAAVHHYKKTLQLTRLLKERAMEAQVCYSLGNTYTLLRDFEKAVTYYFKHLIIAQELNDRVGEGRVCWTLGNIHTALGNHEQAIKFTEKHLEIAIETGDTNGAATARMNLLDLQQVLELKSNFNIHPDTSSSALSVNYQGSPVQPGVKSLSTTEGQTENQESQSPENKQSGDSASNPDSEVDVFPGSSKSASVKASTKLLLFQQLINKKHKENKSPAQDKPDNASPFKDQPEHTTQPADPEPDEAATPKVTGCVLTQQPGLQDPVGADGFLDLLSRFQGHRMDDQRCTVDGHSHFLAQPSPSSTRPVAEKKSVSGLDTALQDHGHFLELLASSQARRLNDQRVSLSHFPGLRLSTSSLHRTPSTSSTSRACSQASSTEAPQTPSLCGRIEVGTELGDEDSVFFDMIEKCQGSRWNDQRCAAPCSSTISQVTANQDSFKLISCSQSERGEEQCEPPPPDATPTSL